MVAVHSSSQVSWACSGTWLWTNRRAAIGVEAGGEQVEGGVEGAAAAARPGRFQGQGVQVDDAVEGVVVVLVGHPLANRAEVVAEVEVPAGLDAGQDP